MPDPTKTPETAAELAESLGPALLRLVRQFRAGVHAAGLSPAQTMLLKRLQARPGMGVSELAAAERIRRPTISGHIKLLAAEGLVERMAPNEEDRRRVGFRVTPAGSARLQIVWQQWTAWLASRLDELPAAGRHSLADALPHLRAMGADSDPTA
jgi:DNA-binding MarR family transcriptional regulator